MYAFLDLGHHSKFEKCELPAKMIEQQIRHVIHHHRPEVKRVVAVPLARARGHRDIVLVARILVTWKERGGVSMFRMSFDGCSFLPFCQLGIGVPKEKARRVRVAPDLNQGNVIQVVHVPLTHSTMRK